jgi:alkanesulfonate monooxygenase SsuD/methylene tetrahydromethanopterin reductase-like flavin-dependent oxidoreductase (luciferase family)
VARRVRRLDQAPEALRERGLFGSPAQIVDRIGEYAQIGAVRIHLQFFDMEDLDHIEMVASEVVSQVR